MSDVHIQCPDPTNEEMEAMRSKMLAYIYPNTPRTESQTDAFEKACRCQISHEKTAVAKQGKNGLPDGTKTFAIGDFSMTFEDGTISSRISKRTVCPQAHGMLLLEGLLYKGVERAW